MQSLNNINCCRNDIRVVRQKLGFDLEKVALILNVPVVDLDEFENDPSQLPIDLAVRILSLYNVSFSEVCFQQKKRK